MWHLIGFWHQVEALSAWTGLSVGALVGLALLVWWDPALLKPAIAAAALVITAYAFEIHGNLVGLRDGRAEIQVKWDAEKAAIARARAAELAQQQAAAAAQAAIDKAKDATLTQQTDAALARIESHADGRKALLESWRRARELRGIK
jgi:hypothetical protein